MLPKGRGVYFDDPSVAIALRADNKTVSSRRSGRSRRAAPVFQSSPRYLHISLHLKLYLVFRVCS